MDKNVPQGWREVEKEMALTIAKNLTKEIMQISDGKEFKPIMIALCNCITTIVLDEGFCETESYVLIDDIYEQIKEHMKRHFIEKSKTRVEKQTNENE